MESNKRIPSFDVLRFFMITIIAIWHFPLINPFSKGYLAVEFFFIISGFLTLKKFNKQKISSIDYIVNKYKKLYIGYLIGFILVILLHLKNLNYHSITSLLPEFFLVQNIGIFHGTGYYYPMWFLSVLIWGGGFCILLLSLKQFVNIIIIIIPIFYFTYIANNYKSLEQWGSIGVFYLPLWRGISDICIGFFLYKLYSKYFFIFNKNKNLFDIIAFICFLSLFCILYYGGNDCFAVVLIALLIIILHNPNSTINNVFDKKICYLLGSITFEMYFIHAFWINILTRINNKFINFQLLSLLYLLLLIFSSFLAKKAILKTNSIINGFK